MIPEIEVSQAEFLKIGALKSGDIVNDGRCRGLYQHGRMLYLIFGGSDNYLNAVPVVERSMWPHGVQTSDQAFNSMCAAVLRNDRKRIKELESRGFLYGELVIHKGKQYVTCGSRKEIRFVRSDPKGGVRH